MTKLTATALKPGNGKPTNEDLSGLAVVKTVLSPESNNSEEKKALMKIEPEKPVIPVPEPKKEMTLIEKILKEIGRAHV